MKKILSYIINSKIYISISAVILTFSTQIQLELKPNSYAYLSFIFLGTLLIYNRPRILNNLSFSETDMTSNKKMINKRYWFLGSTTLFIIILTALIINIKAEALTILTLLSVILTIFYSIPISNNSGRKIGLRQIPYLKIFLISFVWANVTVMFPVIICEIPKNDYRVIMMLIERFLFVFAITIPFDIKDMEADRISGLRTIPMLIGQKKSIQLSLIILVLFFTTTTIHYSSDDQYSLVLAHTISFLTTLLIIKNKNIQNSPIYYFGILDGTLLIQGALVIVFYLL